MNRFIGNLLDMTRIESGSMKPRTGPIELSDVIGSALRRAGKILAAHRTQVRLEPGLPMLDLDDVLLEQVLFNLLDNAAKYAPAGSLVTVRAWRQNGQVSVQVIDEGPGIAPADLEHVFDKFYRAGVCRPSPRRNRPRAGNLPRVRRGDARHHNRRQSHRSNGGSFHHYCCRFRSTLNGCKRPSVT